MTTIVDLNVRLRAYGRIVEALAGPSRIDQIDVRLDALDAVADLLTDDVRIRRAHNREMIDEQREAQRAVRDAHTEGRLEAYRDQGDW